MKKSQISFKFKNEKNYDSINFVGGSITLKDLKTKIKEKLQQTKASSGPSKDKDKDRDEILVYDEQTKQLLRDDNTVITSDKKVIIERAQSLQIPYTPQYMSQGYRPTDQRPSMPPIQTQPSSYYMIKPTQPTTTQPSAPDTKQLSFQDIQKYFIEAKYFMIKSANYFNIERSIAYGEWATTKSNEAKLNSAYNSSKNVILLFSVNKSSQFQGYARMESPSTNKVVSWQDQDAIKLGGCFKVNWLRVCPVNFSRIAHLKNKYNNNEPIKKSRDTQELPPEIGYEICKMFEVPDRDVSTHYPVTSDYGAPRKLMPYGSQSQGEIKEVESISETTSPSDRTPGTNKPQTEEGSSEIQKVEEFKEEIKEEKPEKKVDLLADLDFGDELGFGFGLAPEEPAESEKQKPGVEEEEEESKSSESQQQLQEKESSKPSEAAEEGGTEVEEIKTEEEKPKEPEKPQIQNLPPEVEPPPMRQPQPEMLMRPQLPIDNRPPPPSFPSQMGMGRGYPGYGMYPPSYPQMPYQYPGSYPMMPPSMQNVGMGQYFNYPGYGYQQMTQQMWPGQQQQYPSQMPGAFQGQKKDEESEAESEESDRSRKREKKKKEKKKKKKRSSTRSRSRSRSKSKSYKQK